MKWVWAALLILAVVEGASGIAMTRSYYRELRHAANYLMVASALLGLVAVFMGTRRWRSPTRVGAFFLTPLLAMAVFVPAVTYIYPNRYNMNCRASLSQVGKAIYSYRANADGHFPFDARGPQESLALLYPSYLPTLHAFRCSWVSSSILRRDEGAPFPPDSGWAGGKSHFGYTWRMAANAPKDFAIAADFSGNHADQDPPGFNVLYADGRVAWQMTVFCSHDPRDNIFAPEPGWDPDTDTFIRLSDGGAARRR